VLRASKAGLLAAYNSRIRGIEGRGISFDEFTDGKGRPQMKHSFLNFHGHHEIQGPENQMLVLLFMAWFVADQYAFLFRDIVGRNRYGFDGLHLTVVSDKLSGDDDYRRKSERNLRNLIDSENDGEVPLVLARSRASDTFSGDLMVDNLVGWLTAAMNDPGGSFAGYARGLIASGVWTGWHHLQLSTSKIEGRPAIERLGNDRTA
jgi:hypothetical protein